MADAFAPKMTSDVRFNQPIEQPSMVGTLAQIGEGFLSSLPRGQRTTTAAPKTDPNLAIFVQGLDRIEAVRDQRGEIAAQIEERKLASNYASAGISFDDDYKAVYEKTTGRQWAGYGEDYEANVVRETLAKPEVQASYVASFAINPSWTEEQRVEYAIGEQAKLTYYRGEIEQSKAKADYTWTTNSEVAYNGAIDTFVNQNLGSLVAIEKQGGTVGPQAIANLSAQWGQYKVNLSRPPNVSDEQWKSTQDKISNVDKMIETLTKASSQGVLVEELTTSVARSMLAEGGGSTQSVVTALTVIKSPETLANLGGLNIEGFIMETGKSLNINATTQSLFGHIIEDSGSISGDTDPDAFLTTVPQTVKEAVAGKTPQQIYDGLNASGRLSSIVGQANLQSVDGREQFVTNGAAIGAVMMETGSDQFLSNDFLKKLVANPNFIRNVKALDAIDPESATVTRTYVRSGLNVELGKQTTNLSSIDNLLEGKGVVWDGTAYVMTPEAAQGGRVIPGVGGFGGIPTSALQDNAETIRQAMDRRASIGTINATLSALAAPVDATTKEAGGAGSGSAGTNSSIGASLGIDFTSYESEYKLPAGFLERTAFLESRGDPSAQNPSSSAGGLFQQIDSNAKAYGVTDRFDPVQSTVGAAKFAAENATTLRRALGREPTGAELYLAHQQGPGGATKLLTNPNAKAVDIVGEDAVRLNGGDVNMTATEFANLWIGKYNNDKGLSTTTNRPSNANSVASASGQAVQRASSSSMGTPSAPMTMPAGVATKAPATVSAVDGSALPKTIKADSAGGSSTSTPKEGQTPVIDKEVKALVDNLAPKTVRQLRRAGIDPSEVKFYKSILAAEKAIGSGDLAEGEAFVLPDGSVRIVEGD